MPEIFVPKALAPAVRQALACYVRLSVEEKRGWFSVTFTVEGPQETVQRALKEVREIQDEEWRQAQW